MSFSLHRRDDSNDGDNSNCTTNMRVKRTATMTKLTTNNIVDDDKKHIGFQINEFHLVVRAKKKNAS